MQNRITPILLLSLVACLSFMTWRFYQGEQSAKRLGMNLSTGHCGPHQCEDLSLTNTDVTNIKQWHNRLEAVQLDGEVLAHDIKIAHNWGDEVVIRFDPQGWPVASYVTPSQSSTVPPVQK